MRNIAFVVAVVVFGFMIGMSARAAQPVRGTFNLDQFDECTGEHIVGTIDVSLQFSIKVNGNTGHVKIQETFHGFATGETSGIEYRVNAVESEEENVNFGDLINTGELTFTEHLNLISKGDAPNEGVTIVQHLVYNANGTVTVDRVKITLNCTQ